MTKKMSRSEAVRQLVQLGLSVKPNQVPFTLFATVWGARIGFTNAQLRDDARCRDFYSEFASCFDKDFCLDGVYLTEANLPVSDELAKMLMAKQ